jgi:D-alanine-D-alanine ligase
MKKVLHILNNTLVFYVMRICFAYNVKHKNPSIKIEEQDEQEYDSPEVLGMIRSAIEESGHEVIELNADKEAFNKLKDLKGKIDLVFTTAEGVHGDARESQISIYCEVLQIPYTHSSPTTHAIGLDKLFTKLVLKAVGIKVPKSVIIQSLEDPIGRLKYPVLIKPNSEGSSVGIMNDNVVFDRKTLLKRLKEIQNGGFKGKLLIEEFIEGREFTVSVIGNDPPRILPIIEQKFDFLPKGYHKIASYELKWLFEDKLERLEDAYVCPAKIDEDLEKKIRETTLLAYKTLRILDCARIDFRLDNKSELYLLEVNTIPGLNFSEKEISYFPLSSRIAGMKPKDVVGEIIDSARKRYGI